MIEPNQTQPAHVPVLLTQVLQLLAPKPGEVYADCTAGGGGHAEHVAARLGPSGTVILNDLDEGSLEAARSRVEAVQDAPRVVCFRGNFADLPRRMAGAVDEAPGGAGGLAADMLLADLGFSSAQMDAPERGFSFQREGPLDMRLHRGGGETAADLVNALPEAELESIIREYGEERMARAVARKLVAERERSPIDTTTRLAEIIRSVVGVHGSGNIDPATRTFQALRIAVNDELGNLASLLESVERGAMVRRSGSIAPGSAKSWLAPGARVAVISFHSLEDRLVKRAFQRMSDSGLARLLTRKPVTADEDEVRTNRRSRSARLRAVELL